MTVSASEIRNIARHNGHGPAAGREQLVAILAKSTLRVRKPRRNIYIRLFEDVSKHTYRAFRPRRAVLALPQSTQWARYVRG